MASGRGDSLYMSSNQQPARRTRSSAPSRLLLRSAISTLHIPPSPPRPGGSLLPYPAVFRERSALFAPICPVLACEILPSLPCAISSQIPRACSGTSPRQRPLDNAYPPSHPSRTTTRPNRLPYSSERCLSAASQSRPEIGAENHPQLFCLSSSPRPLLRLLRHHPSVHPSLLSQMSKLQRPRICPLAHLLRLDPLEIRAVRSNFLLSSFRVKLARLPPISATLAPIATNYVILRSVSVLWRPPSIARTFRERRRASGYYLAQPAVWSPAHTCSSASPRPVAAHRLTMKALTLPLFLPLATKPPSPRRATVIALCILPHSPLILSGQSDSFDGLSPSRLPLNLNFTNPAAQLSGRTEQSPAHLSSATNRDSGVRANSPLLPIRNGRWVRAVLTEVHSTQLLSSHPCTYRDRDCTRGGGEQRDTASWNSSRSIPGPRRDGAPLPSLHRPPRADRPASQPLACPASEQARLLLELSCMPATTVSSRRQQYVDAVTATVTAPAARASCSLSPSTDDSCRSRSVFAFALVLALALASTLPEDVFTLQSFVPQGLLSLKPSGYAPSRQPVRTCNHARTRARAR